VLRSAEIVLRGGKVALPKRDEFEQVDIAIEKGLIVDIGNGFSGESEVDLRDLIVLPGGIDPHVHFNDPGFTFREDFYSGNCAAAAGGITTIIDMPCTSIPPITNADNLKHKLDVISKEAIIDYGLFGGVCAQMFEGDFAAEMKSIANDVLGFKTYFLSGMNSFCHLDHFQFEKVLRVAADLQTIVLLHAEDPAYVVSATDYHRRKGDSPLDYYRSRPEIAEVLAIETAVKIAEDTGADLHIVHISSADGANSILGGRITGETAPHYLAFDFDDFIRIGSPLKVNPPVKSHDNAEVLWQKLSDGVLDFVASDHAPCTKDEKNTGSIWNDYSGIPGVGTILPYMFSEGYLKNRLTLSQLTRTTSQSAAKRYGISIRKGSIEIGKDADFAVIDPSLKWRVRGADFLSMGKITPFEDMVFEAQVVKTFLRGKQIYDVENGILTNPGTGKFLRKTNE